MHREVNSLRLKKQLHEEHGFSGVRFVALTKRGVMALLAEYVDR